MQLTKPLAGPGAFFMKEGLNLDWLFENWLLILFYMIAVNVMAIIVSIVIIISLPTDYLVTDFTPVSHAGIATLRNVIGGIFCVLGVLMLIMPGPGLLAIFCGLVILHSQKKQVLLLKLTSRSAVRRQMQHIRKRFSRPELIFP